MNIEIGQIFTQIVSFLIMLWVLKRYAWKPLLGIMDERRNKIKDEFQSIEDQKKEVDALKQEYAQKLDDISAEAKLALHNATQEGKVAAKEIIQKAHSQAKGIVEKGEQEVQNNIRKSKDQLKNEIVDVAILAAQKMIELNLDEEKQKKLMSQIVEQAEFH